MSFYIQGGIHGSGLAGSSCHCNGGSKGLGQAEAEALAAEGAAIVVATAKSVTDAERVVRGLLDKGGRAVSVQADVSRAEDVHRLVQTTVKTFGRLDILVNNAGTTGPHLNKPWWTCPRNCGTS